MAVEKQGKYFESIVAFLSLWEVRRTIERNGPDTKWIEDVSALLSHISARLEHQEKFVRFSHCSDHICLAMIGARNEEFLSLCMLVSGLANHFLAIGHPLCGVITNGLIYTDSTVFLGPGLSRASQLETTANTHPRIIFDSDMKLDTAKVPWAFQAEDGVLCLDFLDSYLLADYEPLYSMGFAIDAEREFQQVQQLSIHEKDAELRGRYEWLQNFLKRPRRQLPASRLH